MNDCAKQTGKGKQGAAGLRAKLLLAIITGLVLVLMISLPALGSGGTLLISTDSAGNQGNERSHDPAISTDGRYVAFASDASNLVPGDTNGTKDVFLKETQTGAITRVSTDSAGNQGNLQSRFPAISADGRYVAFASSASNLVPGDTNGERDIFVKDTLTGATTHISTDSAGNHGNNSSENPAISADGRYVAFSSYASNLVPGDTNAGYDILIKDTQTGDTTRVSTDSAGSQASGESYDPTISADGRYVAFYSLDDNLVPGDTNSNWDVFLKDTQTGATTRISTDASGNQGNNQTRHPAISGDGRYVAFASSASNLVTGDTNGNTDIFLKDTQTGATMRVSTDLAGNQGNGNSGYPAISTDGRYVVFESYAPNLVPGDTNDKYDVFVKDTLTGTTSRLSSDPAGNQGNGESYDPAISADGRYVAFESEADNLVPGDTNVTSDIFRAATPRHYLFTWYDDSGGDNWVLMSNPVGAPNLSSSLSIAGVPRYYYQGVNGGQTLVRRYPGVMGGPVMITSETGDKAIVSQRILWPKGGNSIEEVLGTDAERLSSHFYWTWYDMESPGYKNWVLIANPSIQPVTAEVWIGGEKRWQGNIAPGQNVIPTFPGLIGGYVEVKAYRTGGSFDDVSHRRKVMASQRVLMNGDTTFNEMPGIPVEELSNNYLWTWYDNVGGRNWVLIANPGIDSEGNPQGQVTANIKIGSTTYGPFTIDPGQSVTPVFPGVMGGPVEVTASGAVIASQRILWGPSFGETRGYAADELSSNYHWTWYDQKSSGAKNWVLIANPFVEKVTAEVWIQGEIRWAGDILEGESVIPTFPGHMGGPVEVRAYLPGGSFDNLSDRRGVMASQRVLWNGYFNEVLGTVLD